MTLKQRWQFELKLDLTMLCLASLLCVATALARCPDLYARSSQSSSQPSVVSIDQGPRTSATPNAGIE